MQEPILNTTRRRLPHWQLAGSVYFVTFRVKQGTLNDIERFIVFEHIKSGDPHFYRLYSTVVMPDHVHLLFRPAMGFDLSRVMKGLKGASARKVNGHRGVTGMLWQDESHDRIVRDEEEFLLKLQYIAGNPVKAGLAEECEQYPFWWLNREACYP
jgi:putative transposase